MKEGVVEDAGEIPEKEIFWHTLTIEDTYKELVCNSKGLSHEEAAKRLEQYGPNKMSGKKKKTIFQRIWEQVANILVGILVFVAVISLIRAFTDDPTTNGIQVGIIFGVIVINTIIGLYQEGKAEEAAEALKKMLADKALTLRGGTWAKIEGTELVPGDVVRIGLGDKVPADLRVTRSANFAVEEAALTGESVPIDKMTDKIDAASDVEAKQIPLGDRKNMVFSSTLCRQGEGEGVVVATADKTQIGSINKLVNEVKEEKSGVHHQIDVVSMWLAFFILLTGIVTWCVSFFTTEKADRDWLESLSVALVCAVAMIPEGLEAIVTVTYAWAVSIMASQNAIITKLPAVETLGSVTVICSDKTGTLTQNIMSVVSFVTSNARYKADVNSKERTNTNFVRDDSYLAERADHTKFMKTADLLKGGANVSRHDRFGNKKDDNPYAMRASVIEQNMNSSHDRKDVVKGAAEKSTDDSPFAEGESPPTSYFRQALATGVLCSKCQLGKDGSRDGEQGNPTEISILRASYFGGIDIEAMKEEAPIIAEVPFDSSYKFMATVHEPREENDGPGLKDKLVVHVKGAPDRMIKLCDKQFKGGSLTETEPIDAEYWIEQIAILSSHGLRCLALLRGTLPKGSVTEGESLKEEFVNGKGAWLTLVGVCAIQDPPRPECIQAVEDAHIAGIRIAMITGDHKDTALAIGMQLGLVDEKHKTAITGPELDALSDEELKVEVLKHNIFARASPNNKIKIVKALKSQGEITGMTGDGVNDAPALKAADMGVAMGKEGTDVARQASKMILQDDNFATIITAVREGRVVWDNLRKVLMVNTPINNAQGMSVLFGLICGLPETPLTAIQVLYCNLICAVTLGFVTAVEPAEEGIMNMPPRNPAKRLIGRFLFLRIALGTIVLVTCTVGSVFWVRTWYEPAELDTTSQTYIDDILPLLRSQASNTLTFGACSITMSARFSYQNAFGMRSFYGNKFAWYSLVIVAVLQVAITYIPGLNNVVFQMGPMKAEQWGIVAILSFGVFVVMEIEKAVRRKLLEDGKVDVGDSELGYFDEEIVPEQDISLPRGASKLNLAELAH